MFTKKNVLIYFIIILIISTLYFAITFFVIQIDNIVRENIVEKDNIYLEEAVSYISVFGDFPTVLKIATLIPDEKVSQKTQKALFVSTFSSGTLKMVIGKRRPPDPIEFKRIILSRDYRSMPSGHTTFAFTLATMISHYYPEYTYEAYALALMVGIHRIYEDEHWFSDLVMGAIIGYISAKFVAYCW